MGKLLRDLHTEYIFLMRSSHIFQSNRNVKIPFSKNKSSKTFSRFLFRIFLLLHVPKKIKTVKEFFRTCNVLPFSCTHLGKRSKVHAKQKGFKNFFKNGCIKIKYCVLTNLYDNVVYFLISSSMGIIPILFGSSFFAVAEPKSHKT